MTLPSGGWDSNLDLTCRQGCRLDGSRMDPIPIPIPNPEPEPFLPNSFSELWASGER